MKILNLGSLNIDKTYSVKRFVQPKETNPPMVMRNSAAAKD